MRNEQIQLCAPLLAAIIAFGLGLSGLTLLAAEPGATEERSVEHSDAASSSSKTSRGRADSEYILGPGDQIVVDVVSLEEIHNKRIPIDLSGSIRLPLVGRVQASDHTTAGLEKEITQRLKAYVLEPDVTISVAEFHSQPVSVIGAVRNPGVQQVEGRKTLLEVLSLAGGLDTNAGSTLSVTRQKQWGPIPLPNAKGDPSGLFSVADLDLRSLLEAANPEHNISVRPNDVISVPRADTIYVIGQVHKSGGFLLNDRKHVTVLQALSMAGGLDRTAKPQNARLLRYQDRASSRIEIPVNLKRILDGELPDVHMQPEDILFVPNNIPKSAAIRALNTAIQMGTGVVIWGRY